MAPTWEGRKANPMAANMVSTFSPEAGATLRSTGRTAASWATGAVAVRTTNCSPASRAVVKVERFLVFSRHIVKYSAAAKGIEQHRFHVAVASLLDIDH